MDRLWLPLLAHHFGDVVPPAPLLLLSPARRFRALALTPCSVCDEILLPLEPRLDPVWSRYSVPRSCGLCDLPCCSTCHCRCRCLDEECDIGKIDRDYDYDCKSCRAWAHEACYESFSICPGCQVDFCFPCASKVFGECEMCDHHFCLACRRNENVLGDVCRWCFEAQDQSDNEY